MDIIPTANGAGVARGSATGYFFRAYLIYPGIILLIDYIMSTTLSVEVLLLGFALIITWTFLLLKQVFTKHTGIVFDGYYSSAMHPMVPLYVSILFWGLTTATIVGSGYQAAASGVNFLLVFAITFDVLALLLFIIRILFKNKFTPVFPVGEQGKNVFELPYLLSLVRQMCLGTVIITLIVGLWLALTFNGKTTCGAIYGNSYAYGCLTPVNQAPWVLETAISIFIFGLLPLETVHFYTFRRNGGKITKVSEFISYLIKG